MELITASADVWTNGRFQPCTDTLTYLCGGPSYGFQNRVDRQGPQAVANTSRWTRLLPAGVQIHSERPPGHWTYLLITFPTQDVLRGLALNLYVPRIASLLDEIGRCVAAENPDSHAAKLRNLTDRLIRDLRGLRLRGAVSSGDEIRRLPHWSVKRVANQIELQLHRSLLVQELSDIAGLRRSQFCEVFRQTVGLPPHQYLLERRLQRGRDALQTSGCSVTQVALNHGFNSAAHFSTAFRRRFGHNPRQLVSAPAL